jgi:oligopeptide transport system substrate-binding protein
MTARPSYCWTLAVALVSATALGACFKRRPSDEGKVFHYGLRAKINSLDPVRASLQYDGFAQSQVYEPLYTYKYLVRPVELTPLLAAAMPDISDDQRVYTIPIKPGVLFHDDACFAGGAGREVTAQDFVYSFKRMADRDLTPDGWWIFNDRIVGFDEFQRRMNARPIGAPFDWDAPVEGLQAIDRYTLRITLHQPYPQLLYVLAMTYTSAVARECAEYYGKQYGNRAIGTGPFVLRSWQRGHKLVYERNPKYRADYYPNEASDEARQRGLLAASGQKVPFLDGLVLHILEESQPAWLKFLVGDLHMVQVAAEYQPAVFDSQARLRRRFADQGMQQYNLPLLDFIYKGFNMQDPVTGRGPRARLVRKAISCAVDTVEINDAFYENTAILYDGPIAPGLDGYDPGVLSADRGPNLERARQLLAEAGYPDGIGLPPLQYHVSSESKDQAEMLARQLRRAGIRLDVQITTFPELTEKLNRKKAQMFSLAWGADYPDAENFLQLFYGPNEAPGSNNFNYKNPEYDRLFEQIRTMQPGPERTAIYRKMRDILIADLPAFGSMARTRFYLWHGRLKNVYPAETWYRWVKYLDLDREVSR